MRAGARPPRSSPDPSTQQALGACLLTDCVMRQVSRGRASLLSRQTAGSKGRVCKVQDRIAKGTVTG